MKLLPVLLLCVCLAGCATGTKLPAPDATSAIVSTREQFGPLSTVQWLRIDIPRVDDDMRFFVLEYGNADLKLKPGPTVLRLKAMFHAWPTAPETSGIREARISLPVNLEAARVYRVTGEPRGGRFFAWVEDGATGERLGPEVSEPHTFDQSTIFVVPIRR